MTQSLGRLSPSTEARLAAWSRSEHQRNHPATVTPPPSVTLSREFGCEAFPLAERLAALFARKAGEEWTVFDRVLLERVASEQEIPLHLLQQLGHRNKVLEGLGLLQKGAVSHDVAFQRVAELVLPIASQGHAILVGRAGAWVCRDLPNCFHFRLVASLPRRVASIQRRLGLSAAEATTLVQERSAERESFIYDVLKIDLSDARHYDAIFNTDRTTLDEAAEAIATYVQRYRERLAGAGARG
jgi:cytidylate kinase